MNLKHVKLAMVLAAGVLSAAVLSPSSRVSAQADNPSAATLKKFISVAEWQLDVTWTAKDSFENKDVTANLEMTATARFILAQADKTEGVWARWRVAKSVSDNLSIDGVLVDRHDDSRTEFKSAGTRAFDAGVMFSVGGRTPGYDLNCTTAFPIKLINSRIGTRESLVTLLTTDIRGPAPVAVTGPLPTSGKTIIHGSLVIPMAVPPFAAQPIPSTRVGVEFVLQPYVDSLAPLVPTRKK